MTSTFRPDLFVGRRALVLGGTSGIGAAVVEHLASLGATVTAAGQDTDRPQARALAQLGPVVAEVDVRDEAAVTDLVTGHDRLDVLVNSAGVIRRDVEHRPNVFAEVVDINLTGTMRACSAARETLGSTGGCIVNIASMLSLFGGSRVPAYAASKSGIVGLTRSLAIAYAEDGIRVNAVAPGWIRTEFTAALHDEPAEDSRIVGRTPMKRWGAPEEIADAVAFLAGPAAGFVTGAVLPVDGGYHVA